MLADALAAARAVADEQRPALWDRLRCAVGSCRLYWHVHKEGPVVNAGVYTGYYRVYEGVCPICKRSQLDMEKAT